MTQPFHPHIVPNFTVTAVEPLRDFYIEKLGFDHMMAIVGKDGRFDTAIVVRDGMSVMIGRADGAPNGAQQADDRDREVELYFYVKDVDAYHADVVKRGASIIDPPTTHWWGDRTFRVKDPYGYSIQFAQTVAEFQPPEGVNAV
jgi:PhnB protein